MKARVLVVEDESTLCRNIERYLERAGHSVVAVETGAAAEEMLGTQEFDVVLTDLRLPDMDGLDLLDTSRRHSPNAVSLVMTAYGSMDAAITALQRGAHDFILKPVSLADLRTKIDRIAAHMRVVQENSHLRALVHTEGSALSLLRRGGEVMNRLCDRIEKTAASSCNVLVVGESGTGKELVARALHECSRRATGPFMPLNLAAVPTSAIESYLFGHQRGALPGLSEERYGLFRASSGGTIYLDEVAELDASAQAKLTRAVETKEILPIGADVGVGVDVRVVAATRHDLEQRVSDGHFRRELLFRLRVVELVVPPLRDRLDDLNELATTLIERHARAVGKTIRGLDAGACAALRRYHWPGNVRELSNVLERAVILASSDRLSTADLGMETQRAQRAQGEEAVPPPVQLESETHAPDNLEEAMLRFQRQHIERVLRTAGGNRERAAKLLGLSSATFYRYQQKIGLKGFRVEEAP